MSLQCSATLYTQENIIITSYKLQQLCNNFKNLEVIHSCSILTKLWEKLKTIPVD